MWILALMKNACVCVCVCMCMSQGMFVHECVHEWEWHCILWIYVPCLCLSTGLFVLLNWYLLKYSVSWWWMTWCYQFRVHNMSSNQDSEWSVSKLFAVSKINPRVWIYMYNDPIINFVVVKEYYVFLSGGQVNDVVQCWLGVHSITSKYLVNKLHMLLTMLLFGGFKVSKASAPLLS